MSERDFAKDGTARRRRRLTLPWLETLSRRSGGRRSSAEPPMRMVFMFMPNGVRPDYWTPPGDGEDYEITPHLKPLKSLKNDFLLLENLWNAKTVGRNGHWPKVPAWLSGGYVERTSGDDLDSGGTSVDQFAAQRIGDRTTLPSFELGIDRRAPVSISRAAASRACTARLFPGGIRTRRFRRRSFRNWRSTACSEPTGRRWSPA